MRRFRIAFRGAGLLGGQPLAEPVPDSGEPPANCDVVVLGGGIVGVTTALFLAEGGARVALFEKGVVAGEASGRAVGFVESMLTDPRKQPALSHSLRIWHGLSDRIGEETSFRGGMLMVMGSQAEADMARAWRDRPGIAAATQVISPNEVRKHLPELSPGLPVSAGVYSSEDGFADPRRATPAIARGAMRKGAMIFQNCAARRVLVSGGTVRGVETERGITRAGHVVLAGGIWNQILAAHLGFDLPQLYGFATATEIRADGLPEDLCGVAAGGCFRPTPWGTHIVGPILSLTPMTPLHLRNAWRFRHALRHLGGSIDLALRPDHWRFVARALRWNGHGQSPFESCRILEPEVRPFSEWAALQQVTAPFSPRSVELVRSWAGALATTPDNMPIAGPVPGIGGLSIGSGMYYGFSFGPGMADLIASGILGREPPFDPAPYDLNRFAGGKVPAFAA